MSSIPETLSIFAGCEHCCDQGLLGACLQRDGWGMYLKLSKWNKTGRITQTRSRGLLMSVDLWLEMLN